MSHLPKEIAAICNAGDFRRGLAGLLHAFRSDVPGIDEVMREAATLNRGGHLYLAAMFGVVRMLDGMLEEEGVEQSIKDIIAELAADELGGSDGR